MFTAGGDNSARYCIPGTRYTSNAATTTSFTKGLTRAQSFSLFYTRSPSVCLFFGISLGRAKGTKTKHGINTSINVGARLNCEKNHL